MSKTSVKHLQIDKSQSTVLVVIALTTALVIFGLFAEKALITKGLYQKRALSARRAAANDLKNNYDAAQTLFKQYKVFAEQDPNVLGGAISGNGDLDGDNPKLVLDALPSIYDAPALATSIEKIMTEKGMTITALNVQDDPTSNSDAAQANPQSKTITFTLGGTSNYQGVQKLLQTLEQSIRPFNVQSLTISGTDNSLNVSATIDTYYQPAKSLDLSVTKEVK